MKKMILISAASIAAALLFSSCEQKEIANVPNNEKEEVLLSVGLEDVFQTKGQTAWTSQQEKAVQNWQVFVFNEDGLLDVSAIVIGGEGTTLKCTAGQKAVYALVNYPTSLVGEDGVNDEDGLLEIKTKLSDNEAGSQFVMFGGLGVTVPTQSKLTIPVTRFCSKVYIDSIENQLSGSYGNITVTGYYITNAAGDAVLGDDEYTPGADGSWYNKMGYSTSGLSAVEMLLAETSLSEVIAKGKSSSTPHYFYCYPNRSTSTTQGGDWSPRCSRLVIETEIEGDNQPKRYYAIRLIGEGSEYLEKSKYFHIKKLVINHLGSTDPDTEANISDLSIDLSISEWGKGFEEEKIIY